jgi:hypothetical protein
MSVTERGDELFRRLTDAVRDSEEVGSLTYALLQELFNGYPVSRLRALLHSDEPALVRAGAWLLSELGSQATPLCDEVSTLLRCDVREARYWAIDILQSAPECRDPAVVAQAIECVEDRDPAVRYKAVRLLVAMTDDELRSVVPLLAQGTADLVSWLGESATGSVDEIVGYLDSKDPTTRLFAAAAAARIAPQTPAAIETASKSHDPEVRSFAMEETRPRRRRRQV